MKYDCLTRNDYYICNQQSNNLRESEFNNFDYLE